MHKSRRAASCVCVCVCTHMLKCVQLCSLMNLTRSPYPWNFPGKNTGVGCHFLLQGIFPTQGLNSPLLCLLHCQVDSLPLVPPRKQKVLFLNFWGITILFSIAAAPIYIPINSVWRLLLFYILSDTGHFLFFYNSHTNRCEMISYNGSHLNSLNNWWYWTYSHVLFGYLCPCGKMSIQIFCKYFKHILLLSCMISLYILDIIPYWIYDFTDILSHVVGCLLIFMMVFFTMQKFFLAWYSSVVRFLV